MIETRPRLSRAVLALPAAPVRIVHLGLGAFSRAHQAWYTAHARDAADWGIAAFTGRRPDAAVLLDEQDGLYTVIERGPEQDRDEVVGAVVEAVDGADIGRFVELLRRPEVVVVTLTVTEAGYGFDADGAAEPGLARDVDALRRAVAAEAALDDVPAGTPVGRLLLGLEQRRRADAGPLAVVPCDNLPANGPYLRRGMLAAATAVSADLAAFVAGSVAFVSTSVDRITPRTTEQDLVAAAATADWADRAPVVTEPFSDWVLSGEFPGGRPAWEDAGARFVDDVEPWERRKLWLLNGAHTLLSFAGPPRGHRTVAQAIGDPALLAAVEAFWDEAARHLPESVGIPAYRSALRGRFRNGRIEHRLAQIAEDGTRKLGLRVVPVAEAERAAGRSASGCAFALAAWLDTDAGTGADTATRLADLSPALASDPGFVQRVTDLRR